MNVWEVDKRSTGMVPKKEETKTCVGKVMFSTETNLSTLDKTAWILFL